MANHPRFSVVLPTIGRIEYLTEAIESIRWQTFRDFEPIVSDNSADGSVRSIADNYRHDDRVRYVRPPETVQHAGSLGICLAPRSRSSFSIYKIGSLCCRMPFVFSIAKLHDSQNLRSYTGLTCQTMITEPEGYPT